MVAGPADVIAASERATTRGLEILDQPLGNSRPEHAARLLAVGDAIGARALGLPAGSSDGFRTFRVITYVNRGEHGTPPPPEVASADADVKVGFTVPKGKSIKDLLTFPRGKVRSGQAGHRLFEVTVKLLRSRQSDSKPQTV
jgi:hypothetical protein